jgi:hypothetical protein
MLYYVFISAAVLISSSAEMMNTSGTINADHVYHDDRYMISNYDSLGMTIVSGIDKFDFYFYPDSTGSISENALHGGYRFMINGTFFDGVRGNAGHAGWLKIYGKVIAGLRDENQLSHVVVWDRSSGRFQIQPRETFKTPGTDSTIEFQTGPLIIQNNQITPEPIRKSINGQTAHMRTLLAINDHRELCFITVRKKVELTRLADYLLKLTLFRGMELDVINLDGGSSVAFFSRNYPELDFNSADHLPVIIGVK